MLATTNMPWELDVAVLRRFERRVLLPLPKKETRLDIFKSFTSNFKKAKIVVSYGIQGDLFNEIVKQFSGSRNHALKEADYTLISELTDG